MNLWLFLSVPVIFLFLIGCSSTYKATDYSSKEKFLEDVNNSINNRNFNATAIESSFTCIEGKVKDDSLYAIAKLPGEKIPLKDIKEIQY